jgi:hypothetical protein
LKDFLGFGRYQIAWTWLYKFRKCTIRKCGEPLSDNVAVDEIFVGGRQPGNHGHGVTGKTMVLAAVENRVKNTVVSACRWYRVFPSMF